MTIDTVIQHVTLEETTVRKRGSTDRLQREVEAMAFVRSQTSLPIPKVISAHYDADDRYEDTYIIMERVPGHQLDDAWPRMSCESKSKVTQQLKDYLEELQAIKQDEPGWIGSCSHGPAYDHRIDTIDPCGPFETVTAFNDFLLGPILRSPFPDEADKYRKALCQHAGVRFCHADLSWENILVNVETGDVTAILDWEMAGYWPEWWEYRKARFGGRAKDWWLSLLGQIMQEYRTEFTADADIECF